MRSALALIEMAYGKRPDFSYFDGCSNGGREALMNAQRYPGLFDGIIARAPAFNVVAVVGAWQRNARALAAPGARFASAHLTLLSSSVLSARDAADGIVDGVVSNPAGCDFEPRSLRCASGSDEGEACLSDAQLAALDAITTKAVFGGGPHDHPGFRLTGNESTAASWDA
jgi:feruloyl esterase